MSKLITIEDGYEIRLGQKNPSCYPCCFEGSVCACRSDLCIKHRDNYIREHGKLPQGRYYTAETQEENLGVMDKPVTMTENRLAIRRAFLDGKINAVCGYPGIGKTYLTMIHPNIRGGSNAEIRRYDWIVSGNKHYCSKECYNEDKRRNRGTQKNL